MPPSPLMPAPNTPIDRQLPPHLPCHPKASSSSSPMLKLEFPKLAENLDASSVQAWLRRCEDTTEAWQAMNPDKVIALCTLITLAGLKLEESTAATWWNENHVELKKLATWDDFAQKLKERFCARNDLASAGARYAISDYVLKNHLLFHAHAVLRLRICGQQGFAYATMKVDDLIANMLSTWASLIAEGAVKASVTPALPAVTIPSISRPPSLSIPTPTSSTAASSSTQPFAPLTFTEQEALRLAQGCYHCRKTLQSPGWIKHRSNTCPGNAALGIPPRSASTVVAAVGPVGFLAVYKEGYTPVAAVLPAQLLY
ncbi:hypothetical protein C8J57DRAFT_1518412 [Mycena rebaudengoi]|nr:hypothetical protein C8J57DRAFT_1518412 [Mycena rebaudengoi]